MTCTGQSAPARAVSADGTKIAYWTSGAGAPLLLVHGTTSDHTTWRPVRPYLEPHATVHGLDRRGRGASEDGHEYRLAREFEDVAAAVDAIAEASGSPVDVLGHSFGGLCAFGGAALTDNVRRLVLYEGWPPPNPETWVAPPAILAQLDAMLAAGRREAVIETYYREVVLMSDEELAAFRAAPSWPRRVAAAHTVAREDRATVADGAFNPGEAAKISVPVLLLVGGASPPALQAGYEFVAAALPDVRVVLLDGQQHVAHHLVPDVFADHVISFLRA